MLIETEEMKARPRQILRALLANFDRWRKRADELPHEELAQLVLEESGYVDMWKAERTPDAAGRLDNLKELVRSMGEFPDLGAFLEHVSLVMDVESADGGERVSIMTLHAAKGLEFDLVFLPGWEEGLFPHQRSLDDNGRAGLEEERRLAYVGLTRARRAAKIYHAANRRVRGLWQTSAAVAVHRRTAARPCRGRGDGERVRVRRLRRFPVRRGRIRFALRDAGLAPGGGVDAARGGVAEASGRARRGRPICGAIHAACARDRRSQPAPASSTSNSGRAAWSPPTARSSPSISTAPAASW